MPRVFLLDNYDSFTFNLVQAFGVLGATVQVERNDKLTVQDVMAQEPTHVVISPGPGRPEDAGITEALVRRCLGQVPLLGVCLGHQALTQVLGGEVVTAKQLMHGKMCRVEHSGQALFQGLPNPMEVGRYHSLAVRESSLPPELIVHARDTAGEIMAVSHTQCVAFGVQFHPESILTPHGDQLLANFLAYARSSTED